MERAVGDPSVDAVGAGSMGEITHAAEQPPGNARGATTAPRNFMFALGAGRGAEQAGGAGDDLLEFADRVKVQPDRDSEAVAQRRGQQSLAGGGTDQGEVGQVDSHRAGRGTLADHQVEGSIFHRRVEDFLDRWIEAVDLVDEQ